MRISTATENDIHQLRDSRYNDGYRDQLCCMIGVELHQLCSFNGTSQLS